MDSTNDLSKVKDWINQVYADAVIETEANITSATMDLTAGDYSYTLPSGISRIKQMIVTPVNGTPSWPLIMTSLDDILRRRQAGGGQATATGSTTHYAVLGLTEFEVYPTPASNDTITVYYLALPAALSADADTPILPEPYASKVLEYGALAEAADFKSDPQEQEYRALYMQWVAKLRAHLTRLGGGQPGQFEIFRSFNFPPHDPSADVRYLG